MLKSCTLFQMPLKSSNPILNEGFLDEVKEGDRVYVCTTAIPMFASTCLPKLAVHIVLVSGDGDENIPAVIRLNEVWTKKMSRAKNSLCDRHVILAHLYQLIAIRPLFLHWIAAPIPGPPGRFV